MIIVIPSGLRHLGNPSSPMRCFIVTRSLTLREIAARLGQNTHLTELKGRLNPSAGAIHHNSTSAERILFSHILFCRSLWNFGNGYLFQRALQIKSSPTFGNGYGITGSTRLCESCMKGGRLTFIFPHLNICRVHENKPPYVFLYRSDICTPKIQTRGLFFSSGCEGKSLFQGGAEEYCGYGRNVR